MWFWVFASIPALAPSAEHLRSVRQLTNYPDNRALRRYVYSLPPQWHIIVEIWLRILASIRVRGVVRVFTVIKL